MNYVRLGRTGLKVSEYCIGADNFGGQTDEGEALRIMSAAFDGGVTSSTRLTPISTFGADRWEVHSRPSIRCHRRHKREQPRRGRSERSVCQSEIRDAGD